MSSLLSNVFLACAILAFDLSAPFLQSPSCKLFPSSGVALRWLAGGRAPLSLLKSCAGYGRSLIPAPEIYLLRSPACVPAPATPHFPQASHLFRTAFKIKQSEKPFMLPFLKPLPAHFPPRLGPALSFYRSPNQYTGTLASFSSFYPPCLSLLFPSIRAQAPPLAAK